MTWTLSEILSSLACVCIAVATGAAVLLVAGTRAGIIIW